MSKDLRLEYNNLKAGTRGPLWQFSGLGLIALLIAFGAFASGQDEKNRLKYAANPMTGDIYKCKMEGNNYSTLKVTSVSPDSVFVSPNKYQTDKMSAVYKLDETDNYMKESYGISRTDLKQMLKDNDIYDIDRN